MIRLYWDNEFDKRSIESSTENERFPAANLQQRWKTKRWRSTNPAGQYVRSTGGVSQVSAGFFLLNGNISESATVRIKGSDDGWSTTPFDELMLRGDGGDYAYLPASPISYNDYGVYIDDPGNTDGYVSAGRFWYSDYWQPLYGFMPRPPAAVVKEILTTQSSGGQISTLSYRGSHKRWAGLKFSAENDIDGYRSYIEWAYKMGHFVVFQPKGHAGYNFPDYENNFFYVRLEGYNESNVMGQIFSFSIDLTEEQ